MQTVRSNHRFPRLFTASALRRGAALGLATGCLASSNAVAQVSLPVALDELAATSTANAGVQSGVSFDDAILYHARGPLVQEVDLSAILANEEAPAGPTCPAGTTYDLASHSLEASITALRDGGAPQPQGGGADLWVGGGDFGLFHVDRAGGANTVSLVDGDVRGRWVFDLALDEAAGRLYAICGGIDQTQLRIYDTGTRTLLFNVRLDTSTGVALPGTGYGLDFDENVAGTSYVAMGAAGVIKLTEAPPGTFTVAQGPLPSRFAPTGADLAAWRFRDVTVEGDFVYVAAESAGVLAIDTTLAWGQTTPVVQRATQLAGSAIAHYPVRVDAETDALAGVILAVGAAVAPSLAHEWGNYCQYGNFDWTLAPAGIDASPFFTKRPNALFAFAHDQAAGALVKVAELATGAAHVVDTWRSLDVHFDSTSAKYWIVNEGYRVFDLDVAGAAIGSSGNCYDYFTADHTLSIPSQLDPNVLLTGQDGSAGLGQYAIGGAPGAATIDLVPGTTTDPKFHVGLFVQDSWVDGGFEWTAAPTGADPFSSDGSGFTIIRLLPGAAGFPVWDTWSLARPDDPCEMWPGRGYTTLASAWDTGAGTDLLALCRTAVPNGVSLYRPSQIMSAASATAPGNSLSTQVSPFAHLSVHDEVCCPPPAQGGIPVFRSLLFDWENLAGEKKLVLAVAAGIHLDPASPNFEKPMVVFYDLEDCRTITGSCGAAIKETPPSQCGDTIDPTKRRVALSLPAQAKAFGITVAEINGTQFLFTADTSGSVVAFDLTRLFPGGGSTLRKAGSWTMRTSRLDGLPVPCTDVLYREEYVGEGGIWTPRDVLYVGANRRGVIRVEVIDNGPGTNPRLSFAELQTINTPGQPTGLSLVQPTLGTTSLPGLMVSDHGSAGLKLYVE